MNSNSLREAPLKATNNASETNQLFIPKETVDNPFDVTLVVSDSKEIKVHRGVLSEASLFFEKLLNTNMRESNEAVINLEMLTESCLRDILEYIYTGAILVLNDDMAQELLGMADYLVLPNLKTLASKYLIDHISANSSISSYYLAEKYHCEELLSVSKTFILANFTTVAKTEDFLNLPGKEVKMWISSDDIQVSAEEDVFKIILRWIGHVKIERNDCFVELFREVRLIYVSRDFLHSDIVTNDLVNDNEYCIALVKDAIRFVDSKGHLPLCVKPRNSLEIPVVFIAVKSTSQEYQLVCYLPRENKWTQNFRCGTVLDQTEKVIGCQGKLYFISQTHRRLLCYDSLSNYWTQIQFEEQRNLLNVFVRHNDEMWALMSEDQSCCHLSLRSHGNNQVCGGKHLYFFAKYKPESNEWEEKSSFELEKVRVAVCVVANSDSFIYFLGGSLINQITGTLEVMADCDRYDCSTNTWQKISDMKYPKSHAYGAAKNGNVFIASDHYKPCPWSGRFEVYYEATNEWHVIADPISSSKRYRRFLCGLVVSDHNLYSLNMFLSISGLRIGCQRCAIQCYEHNKNEWTMKSQSNPVKNEYDETARDWFCRYDLICSMRVFKGSEFLQQALNSDVQVQRFSDEPEILGHTLQSDDLSQEEGAATHRLDTIQCKCAIL